MPYITRIDTAERLDDQWDALASSYYQRRSFLQHCEQHNPCHQRYYLLRDGELLLAGVILYTMPLDLLTYVGLPSPVRMHIAGIPASASPGGFIGAPHHQHKLARELAHIEQGFVLLLNLDAPLAHGSFTYGSTLPTVHMNRTFASFDDYTRALRADYRRRLFKITGRFTDVVPLVQPCRAFTEEMYRGYEAVWSRSDAKLEKLTVPFFQNLPEPFSLTTFHHDGTLIGWHITLQDGDTFVFFMGGIDYALKERFDTYFNITADVASQAFDSGFTKIDFGQTAEVPKTRLGGVLHGKFMGARHSNPALNLLLRLFGKQLAYKRRVPEVHVFRKEN